MLAWEGWITELPDVFGIALPLNARIHKVSATHRPRSKAGRVTWGRLGFSSPLRERTP